MEKIFVLKGLLITVFLIIGFDLLKSKPEFGVQYKIKSLDGKKLILTEIQKRKDIKVSISFLDENEQFSVRDVVQMHSVWREGSKRTIYKLKKV